MAVYPVRLLMVLVILNSSLAYATAAGELDCMVKPEMYVELSSPVDGVLDTLLVENGGSVKKGEVVAVLESSVEAARVKLAKQEAAVEHTYTAKQIELEFTERNKKRYKDMYDKESAAYYEADRANTDVALAKVAVDKSVSEKKAALLQLQLAQAQLEQKSIKSPINGIVVERYLMPGESVNGRPIMKLAQVNPLRVELVAPAALFGQVRKGMSVDIKPEKPANQHYRATVTNVDQLIDPASGSFKVRLSLPNPDDKLVAGVNCTANLHLGALETSVNEPVAKLAQPEPAAALQVAHLDSQMPAEKVVQALAVPEPPKTESLDVVKVATSESKPVTQASQIPTSESCVELGPFANKSMLHSMLKSYVQDKQIIAVENKDQEILTGYNVYLPAADSHEQVMANYDQLKKQFGKEVVLFTKGPLKDSISLGFAAQEVDAKRLAERYVNSGFGVQIRPQHKSTSAYFARLQGVSTQQISAQLQMSRVKNAPILSVHYVDCQAIPAVEAVASAN